jgi:hypothetical protein
MQDGVVSGWCDKLKIILLFDHGGSSRLNQKPVQRSRPPEVGVGLHKTIFKLQATRQNCFNKVSPAKTS